MKLIPKKIDNRVEYISFRFYFEDLEAIIGIANNKNIISEISDNDYFFETLEEIKEYRGNKLKKLNILLRHPDDKYNYISISFSGDQIVIFRPKSDDLILPLWHEIVYYFNNKAPSYVKLFNIKFTLWIALSSLPIAMALMFTNMSRNQYLTCSFSIVFISYLLLVYSLLRPYLFNL